MFDAGLLRLRIYLLVPDGFHEPVYLHLVGFEGLRLVGELEWWSRGGAEEEEGSRRSKVRIVKN